MRLPGRFSLYPLDVVWKLPGQDLNLEWQDQNLLCYRLHHRVALPLGVASEHLLRNLMESRIS